MQHLNLAPAEYVDEPTWFGEPENPLFGWLSRPARRTILGGVVIVPSVGYEARCSKGALRQLARQLAVSGFVALRFDFRGTGDSSKDFSEVLPNSDWVFDVANAVDFLHSLGLASVSVVGIRLGATLIGAAMSDLGINVSSVVLWDPCESGGSYLRELRALESLRRSQMPLSEDGSVETAEFVFSREMTMSLRSINLSSLATVDGLASTLIITRTSRPLSSSLHAIFKANEARFSTTDEQEALLNVVPFSAALPLVTIEMIIRWVSENGVGKSTELTFNPVVETNIRGDVSTIGIREHATYLGEQKLFAMLSVPLRSVVGPWIIIIGNIHEDHTGQSRIWVELARRWAQSGLRCARVDLSGLGESTGPNQVSPLDQFDPRWIDDVITLGRSLNPQDPSNTVFIGFCAASQFAMEGGLALNSKGVCVINPLIERNVMHAITILQHSFSPSSKFTAEFMKRLYLAFRRTTVTLWEVLRRILPWSWSHEIFHEVMVNGSNLLILGSSEDLPFHPQVPILRSLEARYAESIKKYSYILVPDFDHAMTFAGGRNRIATLLEEHVRSAFLPRTTS